MDIPRGKDSIGMLPTARHFEKGKTRETVKRPGVKGKGGMDRWNTEDF